MLLITLSRWHRWAHSFDTAHDRLQTETRRFFCLHGFTAVRLFSQLCQVTGYFNKGNKSSGVDWSGLITCSCNIAWVHPWARFSINPMTRSAQPLFWACQEGGKWVDDGHLLLERHWDQLRSPQPPSNTSSPYSRKLQWYQEWELSFSIAASAQTFAHISPSLGLNP